MINICPSLLPCAPVLTAVVSTGQSDVFGCHFIASKTEGLAVTLYGYYLAKANYCTGNTGALGTSQGDGRTTTYYTGAIGDGGGQLTRESHICLMGGRRLRTTVPFL